MKSTTHPTFIDPNARLLASVIPPPPPTWHARAWQRIEGVGQFERRQVFRWLKAREPWQRWLLAGAASAALVLGLYQSGASSATGEVDGDDSRDTSRAAALPPARNAHVAHPSPAPAARPLPASELARAAKARDAVASTQQRSAADALARQDPAPTAESPAALKVDELPPAPPAARRHARSSGKHRATAAHKAAPSRAKQRVAKASRKRSKAGSSVNSEDRVRALLSGQAAARRARTSSL